MKKLYLTIPLLTLALIATGCAAKNTTSATEVNTNTADTEVNAVNTNQPAEINTSVTPTEEGGDAAEEATVTEEVDEYEGWETYTNEEYGFSFRYPSDWIITSGDQYVRVTSSDTNPSAAPDAMFEITSVADNFYTAGSLSWQKNLEANNNSNVITNLQINGDTSATFEAFNDMVGASNGFKLIILSDEIAVLATYFVENLDSDSVQMIINSFEVAS